MKHLRLLVALLLTLVVSAPPALAAGLGDPIFPADGDTGYRVTRYALDFAWQAPKRPFDATTTVEAEATQALSSFTLDFAGNQLREVTVDGAAATTKRSGDKLTVTPAKALAANQRFTATIRYTADPTLQRRRSDAISVYGWIPTTDGTVVYPQPNGARLIFPNNDHPSQKAPIAITVSTPAGITAVATGTLKSRTEIAGNRVRWSYDSPQPVATQLVGLAIGEFTVTDGTGPNGLPLRDAVPTDLASQVEKYRTRTPGHLEWMERRVGKYPFDTYGIVVAHTDLGVALETQTLSMFPEDDLTGSEVAAEKDMIHELAHQWFGNSVTVRQWSDLWLSEGHARFYERVYAAEKGWENLDQKMREIYAQHDSWRSTYGPPAKPTEPKLFSRMVYDGSALVVYALRQKVGAATFEKIQRAWVAQYRDKAASTADFIALASREAGTDLTAFLRSWLYDAKTPPMPGW
ncbi:M1 family metallopeptidase [Allokutzneria albata]|uniref:Aminopeptidase N n=1 Tax=Allokutzneria albata TaxID=211114 RepID=A0A1G9VT33_ALLAB|nr:M1 family metallopeptidase [Allokutzneria albata]SDM75368.1 Peptidase family M1 [Allokutzneria albata]